MKLLIIITMLFCLISCDKRRISPEYISLGTGNTSGLYYPIGKVLGRIIEKRIEEHKIKIKIKVTEGSIENLKGVLNRSIDLGIVQSDRQYQAFTNIDQWKNETNTNELRSICSLHDEVITLISSSKSKIKAVKDIKNKIVNLGSSGSGQLGNSRDIINFFNISEKQFTAKFLGVSEALQMFQNEKIDAFFYTVGHPNTNVRRASNEKDNVRIVPIIIQNMQDLLKQYPYYTKAIIPIHFYPNLANQNDVISLGVKATLVTSKNVDEDKIYKITKAIFDNINELKALHPALYTITKKTMLKGLSAPLHLGTVKYLKENKMLKLVDKSLLP